MINDEQTELERVTDAVRVALVQLGFEAVDVLVHHEAAKGVHLPEVVIRIRVYERPWSPRRLWWWWHGQEAFDRVERRVRYMLSSLEDMQLVSTRAQIFISLDEAP